MPTYKISQLTTATAVSATNQFEINQNGTSKSVEVSVIDAYIKSTSNLPVVVSVSSASNALRITQTGTGNALVVEDSANPDATPFVVDASGRVLIGADSAASSSLNLSIFNVAVATTPAVADFYKNRGGAVVSSGDGVGRIRFYGYDGASYLEAARIDSLVDGTPGTNDMPGNLRFLTTADGASSVTERMRIDSSGSVGIGTTSPTNKLSVNGSMNASNYYMQDSSAAAAGTYGFANSNGPSIQTWGNSSAQTGALLFATSGSERLRIGSAGQIGIGGANYGTSGQVLTSNGSGAAPSWQAAGGSTGTLKNVQVFTSSGTYTRTAGVTTAVVIAVGGGGGGKGANGVTPAAGGNGGAGGTTSFGAHVSAAGGSGATTYIGAAGGTGGTGATIAIKGSPSPQYAGGGQGGGTQVGQATSNVAGVAGVRGGGGSGGYTSDGSSSYAGGGGGQGETAIKYTTTVGATETVTIGAGGTAGTSNFSAPGGAGGAGYIIVYEYS